jgi:amidase
MSDTGMPVGVTLMSAAYRDAEMLQLGVAIADLRPRRVTPPRTPPLADEAVFSSSAAPADEPLSVSIDSVEVKRTGSHTTVRFTASVTAGEAEEWVAYVDGRPAPAIRDGDRVVGMVRAGSDAYTHRHSEWRAAYGPLVTVAIRSASGAVAGAVGTTATGPL